VKRALNVLAPTLLWLAALGLLALVALLAGCAAPKPEIRVVREPVEVRVPVPVACVSAEALPRLPALAGDATLASLSDRDLVLSLDQQRRLLRAHQQQADALLAACARPVIPPPVKEPQ
jgi:type IV pilus biogenesis protein CpaD/CtpE